MANYNDWFDAPLAIGTSFSDPEGTFTIKPVSQNGTSATVSVTFLGVPLTVTKAGDGDGVVVSTPSAINCGPTCTAQFPTGSKVTLKATRAPGSVFMAWGGGCAGAGIVPTCNINMSQAQSVQATFSTAHATTYEEPSATFAGAWSAGSCACFSGGATKYAKAANASASFTFTGTKIGFVSEMGPDRGAFKVYLDGALKTTVDNNAPTKMNAVVRWSKGFASSSTHTIKIVVVGSAGHPRVDVRTHSG